MRADMLIFFFASTVCGIFTNKTSNNLNVFGHVQRTLKSYRYINVEELTANGHFVFMYPLGFELLVEILLFFMKERQHSIHLANNDEMGNVISQIPIKTHFLAETSERMF